MKIGILKETKIPIDRRVVLTPLDCKLILEKYPEVEIIVQKSDIRIFKDEEYSELGIPVRDDISNCDLLLGVKEVSISTLIENKMYMFFSHTIKKQKYNQKLLQEIAKKKITLVDWETLKKSNGERIIGFGKYAGIVGTYNGFLGIGLRTGLFKLKRANECEDYFELIKEIKKIKIPNIKIALTGIGKVAKGSKKILLEIKITEVTPSEFLENEFEYPVFAQFSVEDYYKRKDGKPSSKKDVYENQDDYESDFIKIANTAYYYIAGHFYNEGAPSLLTKKDIYTPGFKINMISDISCDIGHPIASTLRASTIENPFYGYNPKTGKEVDFLDLESVGVMAVNNLPCELPKNASETFSKMFIENVLHHLLKQEKDDIIYRATIILKGKLTPRFEYLRNYLNHKE